MTPERFKEIDRAVNSKVPYTMPGEIIRLLQMARELMQEVKMLQNKVEQLEDEKVSLTGGI